jgi:hypothetical protein
MRKENVIVSFPVIGKGTATLAQQDNGLFSIYIQSKEAIRKSTAKRDIPRDQVEAHIMLLFHKAENNTLRECFSKSTKETKANFVALFKKVEKQIVSMPGASNCDADCVYFHAIKPKVKFVLEDDI